MTENVLAKLFEHNNWANDKIMEACLALSDEQLDAEPHSATKGNIRETLFHLVMAQLGYLRFLTVPLEQRLERIPRPPFAELQEPLETSGNALLALARDEAGVMAKGKLQTTDGFLVEPWVVMLQVINHATEHREQIKSMLTALGVTPPNIDGWDYADATGATTPLAKADSA